jgi:hypothetical protein
MATEEKNVAVNEEAVITTVIQLKPKKTWTGYLWDTFDKSPQERRFLFKLDAAILTFASLGKCSPGSLLNPKLTDLSRIFYQILRPIKYQ